ncbi:MAG: DNA-directed RNA polymerase subunit B [Candidatus Micrarchaeota archaeon]|nr:DNA-directed RNA polymerase subunit B [Candidatus Micrarchaeota archaeon]
MSTKNVGSKAAVPSKAARAVVYINGIFMGETPNPKELVDEIRKKRRFGIISSQVNVAYFPETEEIRINTDSGRARRPVVVIENKKPKLTEDYIRKLLDGEIDWNYLIEHGIVEYLDAEEEENSYIAMYLEDITEEHTHVELHPSMMLGTSANLIPFAEFNRGDRVNYGAKMVGQSIGMFTNNYPVRTDTKFNILAYPQLPLVTTKIDRVMKGHPYGQNVVVAIMAWDGYNLNDAIVMNKSSVERGLFRSFYFRTYETLKKKYWGGQEDEIGIPNPGIKGYRGDAAYNHLGSDGMIDPETPVKSDDIIISKTSPLRFLSSEDMMSDIENKRESSLTVRYGEKGIADSIFITETTDGNQMFKVRIRDKRIPEIGDKFATRHGQKGVISLLVHQEDMPFTKDGIVPDIIFNPHGIPSRMTVGQLLELIGGKASALTGEKTEASIFNAVSEDEIRKMMKEAGFRDDGKEILYDGRTGRKYEVMIFTGIAFYMKLDHMVANKIQTRGRGPVTLLTKQPTEGRSKKGGLRLGEMEQQCLIGHGAALTLNERFNSDNVSIPVCSNCGLMALHDEIKNKSQCPVCRDSEIVWITTSYAFKLLLDEMKSMLIYPRLEVEEI